MREFLEIIVAFLAVFGAWSLIRNLKESILFPKKVRMRVTAAIHDGADRNDRALEYVNYLRAERKIAPIFVASTTPSSTAIRFAPAMTSVGLFGAGRRIAHRTPRVSV